MTAPVVAGALMFWACVFLIYFTAAGTTPVEFFFGRFEPLPPDLGVWKATGEAEAGLRREERCLVPDGRRSARYLLQQVRYRDAISGEIVRVEAERRLPRRRISSRSRS